MARWAMVLFGIGLGLGIGGCADNDEPSGCEWKGHHHVLGELFPDDCNTCTCSVQGVSCSLVACPPQPDGNPASCLPDQACPEGPTCGTYCCGAGEHCVNDACLCGTGPACGPGDRCAGVGPSSGDACGSFCCGNGNPCPL
ncbi:MAG: hypothetical protein K8W52_08460 [Deltaproteobacteria bacterium]|nr:hypothetical protein [Deltaproteobacteria bacterium]